MRGHGMKTSETDQTCAPLLAHGLPWQAPTLAARLSSYLLTPFFLPEPEQSSSLFLFKPSHSSPSPFLLQAALPKPASKFFSKNETPASLVFPPTITTSTNLQKQKPNKKQTIASTISSTHKQSLPRRFHSPTLVRREKENRTRLSLKP